MEEPGRLQIECVNNILLKMIKEMCDCKTERPRKSHGSDYVLCRTKPSIGHKEEEEPGRLQIECVNNILLKMIKEMCDCKTERPRKSHGSDYVLCRTKPSIGHKD